VIGWKQPPPLRLRRDLPSSDYGMASKTELSLIPFAPLTRDLPIARSHHHATYAVYPAASPHAVLRREKRALVADMVMG